MLISLKRSSFLALAVMVACASCRSDAATLCGVSAAESGGELLPFVAGDGAFTQISQILFQKPGESISVSWGASDSTGASAWVATLPDNEERNDELAAYIISISMGDSGGNIGALNAALRLAMEEGREISENDRSIGRERGDESTDREIALNWINSGYYADSILPVDSPIVSVPEPSVSVLGALAGLSLLRRRRQ